MNLRRMRWALLPLLAAAALAVLVLPPRPLPQRFVLGSYLLGFWTEDRSPDVERMHLRTLRVARERLRGEILVRAHGAADVRASREARALRSTHQPLVVVRDADVPDTTARRWLASAERELGFIPRASGTGVPVILALHTKHPQTDSGTVATFGPVVRYQYADRSDSACIVEVVFARRLEADRGRFDVPNGLKGDILGRCGLYARYGFPGPGVGRWAGLPSRWVARWTWFGAAGLFAPRRTPPDTVAWRSRYGGVPWRVLTCLRGTPANCTRVTGLASPALLELADLYFEGFYGSDQLSPPSVLAALITQRGPDRFARFWSSSLPADSALEAVYGQPAGAIVRQALGREFVPAPRGQPRRAAFAVSLGWLLVMAGIAMALSWRREMDL